MNEFMYVLMSCPSDINVHILSKRKMLSVFWLKDQPVPTRGPLRAGLGCYFIGPLIKRASPSQPI
uniref:Putative ovule protein n=1 Tax=Solanum chacoense TaxID=4108 RepID=A0A0V0H8M3_SOLCH